MKLNGGYNFPGSNSGIDLYCLTGWIPEKLYFDREDGGRESDHSTSSDRAWNRLVSAHKFGDCLVTIATFHEMTDADEALTGLVRGHAYAVLDIKEAGRLRMLKVPKSMHKLEYKREDTPPLISDRVLLVTSSLAAFFLSHSLSALFSCIYHR